MHTCTCSIATIGLEESVAAGQKRHHPFLVSQGKIVTEMRRHSIVPEPCRQSEGVNLNVISPSVEGFSQRRCEVIRPDLKIEN
jgi:hypothetical protein